ncbi:MAG TPA: SH3 domain-containing protein [Proteiniclasticum sp.]|nr:SH3 domain-containing protein [Proteiniclasticum sp.]
MRYIVIKNHIVNEANLITLKENDRVLRLEEYIGNPVWQNWVYCISRDTLKEGWIPRAYLKDLSDESVLLEDYSSKELNVSIGDVVSMKKTVNNWAYCIHEHTGQEGWVPLENLEIIKEH